MFSGYDSRIDFDTLIARFPIMSRVDRDRLNSYCWSVPKRLLRAISALTGGALRDTGAVVLPTESVAPGVFARTDLDNRATPEVASCTKWRHAPRHWRER